MKYDGQSITLRPSIGNFNINCKSHYFITENRVEWLNNINYTEKVENKLNTMQKVIRFFKNIINVENFVSRREKNE